MKCIPFYYVNCTFLFCENHFIDDSVKISKSFLNSSMLMIHYVQLVTRKTSPAYKPHVSSSSHNNRQCFHKYEIMFDTRLFNAF
jgi:hypothetical protein